MFYLFKTSRPFVHIFSMGKEMGSFLFPKFDHYNLIKKGVDMSNIKDMIIDLINGIIPGGNRIKNIFDDIMGGLIKTNELKEFLLALKGNETPEIITCAAKAMRNKMIKINVRSASNEIVLDNCGTGGSNFHTFNISTASAFVIAGCGIKVAKHGNRAVSSQFGSSDVLGELGLNLNLSPEKVCEIIKKIGIGFLFAPLYHPAMKHVAQARKELAQKTVFNILGPLCNPAGANVQIIGVFNKRLVAILAEVLNNLGAKHAFIIYSPAGLDEVSIKGETIVVELKEGKMRPLMRITPINFGIKEAPLAAITPGKNSKENAKIIFNVLKGEKSAKTDTVLINAALGIVAAGKTDNLKEATEIARESITSGRAFEKLKKLVELSN